ncbi:DUF6431 domain-containing protein [Carboxydothermus ferrireducens]|uniref:DUF6431 domain-containing protein n=1 Tax=Carboxydothermus ferrireducens TaxID=54265 RepID=UPI0015C6C08D|nr:DUF6431 domain-containing protein [Carboxydothermus ferrireducens]
MIVTYLGASVKEYLENYLIFLEENQWYCPVCSAKMSFHGWYRRKIITLDGTITRIPIARYRCSNCRQTHAILPDFIAPYRHYSQVLIANVVEEVVSKQVPPERVEGNQDIPTTRRWIRQFLKRCHEVIGVLESIAFRYTGQVKSLLTEARSSPWEQMLTALELLPAVKATSVFGAVNLWLTMDVVGLWL